MSRSRESVWSFEQHRSSRPGDGPTFPFILDSSKGFQKRMTGSETKAVAWKDSQVLFTDEYGVSGGLVIGVLFPVGYTPTVFKFKERPQLPVGLRGHREIRVGPPSYFSLHFNRLARRAAVVFQIGSPIYFKFGCLAKRIEGGFPTGLESFHSKDAFDATIRSADKSHISRKDLERFSEVLPCTIDQAKLLEHLQELVRALQDSPSSDAVAKSRSNLERILEPLSAAGSATTILDSYSGSGVIGDLVARVLTYFAL